MAQTKIGGIGPFKIGKTKLSILDTLIRDSGDPKDKKIKVFDDDSFWRNGGWIMEIVPNKKDPTKSESHASYCPSVRVFYKSFYQLMAAQLRNVFLTFNNGVLVRVECLYTVDVEEALKLKYGPPVDKSKVEKSLYCNKKNQYYLLQWKNGKIDAAIDMALYYDSNCNVQHHDIIYVQDTPAYNEVVACSKKGLAQLEEQARQKKLQYLKDF